ncbi:polyprenyl synthetase [Aeromicrobium marinum DSM 15272]|uniref:Polyprenyl synthetase n=1 Tax=Aeromicrobium marinum DSM 15272 TaxID=585531 RepID=E2SAK8_9ACTN|nr:polyprenyl synthetase family protein [Aeromicrobium marinum]EFQ83404.1 polyprenyl synthetase [Aeromicrobium marinum DSM 15272]
MTSDATAPTDLAVVDAALVSFVQHQRTRLDPLGPPLADLVDAAAAYVSGGKRLRPAFCLAGWRVATATPDDTPVPEAVAVAAGSLEWLQGSALVHDDLMDGSDTRRGRPSVHRDFEQRHRREAMVGDPAGFGAATAVLMGDLMLSWCDEMLRSAGHRPGPFTGADGAARLARAFEVLDVCKTEVVAGQFLDVVNQTRPESSAAEAMLVVRYKAAKYTVERPLHLGATLGGGDQALMAGLSAVALPLGEAFQLRDDVLGVFGDPAVTGKPSGDDLREGKRTLLVARTAELGGEPARAVLRDALGTDDGVPRIRDLIASSGALASVEHEIDRLVVAARTALLELPTGGRSTLEPLLARATDRTR